ncbi:MAG: hypothetical protein ACFFDW_08435 [Candidatus Thorarchaeota archaeon]
MGLEDSFVITAGDIQLLSNILKAANQFEKQPEDEEMNALIQKYDIQLILN